MSHSHKLILAAAAAALLATACAGGGANSTTSTAAGDVALAPARWTGQLLPRGDPPLGGRIAISPSTTDGGMVVVLSVSGPPSMSEALGWRLVQGACGTSGVLVGRPGDYTPVVMRSDGSGQSTATIDQDVPGSGIYSVRVYATTSPGAPLLACGDLTQTGK